MTGESRVNIVDLGLIYTVKVTPDANSKRAFPRQRVEVDMTMTWQDYRPRLHHGTGAEPAGGRAGDQRDRGQPGVGTGVDSGPHQPEGTRAIRDWLKRKPRLGVQLFPPRCGVSHPAPRNLSHKLFETAQEAVPASEGSLRELFQTFLTPSGSSTNAKTVPAAATAKPALRLLASGQQNRSGHQRPGGHGAHPVLIPAVVEKRVPWRTIHAFGHVLNAGCYLLRNVCDPHRCLSFA